MGFLNTFIGLSILADESEQSSELQYQSTLLKRQNEIIREQNSILQKHNEQIDFLINENKKQDQIRDYIYRINKLCAYLENTSDKASIDYYYSIYCLYKGIDDSGLTVSEISELKDKEYFDNCIDKIRKMIFEFSRKNSDKISEFNGHIQNIEDSVIFYKLKTSEDAKYRVFQINQRIKTYEKEMFKKNLRSLIGFIPLAVIAFWGFYLRITSYFLTLYLEDFKYYGICVILGIFAIVVGKIVGKIWTRKALAKQKETLSEEEYKNLLLERADCEKKILKDKTVYDYARKEFPEFGDLEDESNFSKSKIGLIFLLFKRIVIYVKRKIKKASEEVNGSYELERFHVSLLEKDEEISNSFVIFRYPVAEIYEKFYLNR